MVIVAIMRGMLEVRGLFSLVMEAYSPVKCHENKVAAGFHSMEITLLWNC